MHALDDYSDYEYLFSYCISLCLSAEPHLKPFLLLKECMEESSRVQVWTRHIAGLRGIAEGILLLFDHHFNMVLQDVWEVFVPFKPQGRQRKRPQRSRKDRKRQNLKGNPAGGSCTTGGQVLGVSEQWTVQSSQEYPSIAEDISSYSVSDEENSNTDCEEQTGAPHGLDPLDEAIISSSDSEVKTRTDHSEMEKGGHTNRSSCRGTEHQLPGHPCTGRHTQCNQSVGQSGEELCAFPRYPLECHGLLALFAAHGQHGCGTTSTPPLWQHSKQVFIRGDSVILVARTCK